MNKITLKDIEKIAKLIHIKITNEEAILYQKEINNIVTKMIKILYEAKIDNVKPFINAITNNLKTRKDIENKTNTSNKITSNAYKTKNNYFIVPKVI